SVGRRTPCSRKSPSCTEKAYGYDGPVATDALETMLRQAFPDAEDLRVEDRTGGGDHFQVTVASARFDGLSLVDQHKLVYAALGGRPSTSSPTRRSVSSFRRCRAGRRSRRSSSRVS